MKECNWDNCRLTHSLTHSLTQGAEPFLRSHQFLATQKLLSIGTRKFITMFTMSRDPTSDTKCHVFPGNVTNNSWNACLTLRFIWLFLGRATAIHFTNLLYTNKSLVFLFSSGALAVTSELSVLKVLSAELFWTPWWTELELTVASLL
jgi:hypothetical protein